MGTSWEDVNSTDLPGDVNLHAPACLINHTNAKSLKEKKKTLDHIELQSLVKTQLILSDEVTSYPKIHAKVSTRIKKK